MNIIKWSESMPSVRIVIGSTLTICFGFASAHDTFDGSAFFMHFLNKISGLAFVFSFRVLGQVTKTMICSSKCIVLVT